MEVAVAMVIMIIWHVEPEPLIYEPEPIVEIVTCEEVLEKMNAR
jgi:hypothetical protein